MASWRRMESHSRKCDVSYWETQLKVNTWLRASHHYQTLSNMICELEIGFWNFIDEVNSLGRCQRLYIENGRWWLLIWQISEKEWMLYLSAYAPTWAHCQYRWRWKLEAHQPWNQTSSSGRNDGVNRWRGAMLKRHGSSSTHLSILSCSIHCACSEGAVSQQHIDDDR